MTAAEVIEAARNNHTGSRKFTDVPIVCSNPRYDSQGLSRQRGLMLSPGSIDLAYLRYELDRWNVVRPWGQEDAR